MKYLLILAVLVMAGCGPKPNPNPPPNPEPQEGDLCVAAQENLLRLQCQDEGRLLGGPTRRGMPFDAFCREKIDQGVMTTQDALCLSKITDCSQVDVVCSWGE